MENNPATPEVLGTLSALVCPECSGPLWEIEAAHIRRYRCYIGHAYTARTLLSEHGETIEEALWAALRMFEERVNLLTRMTTDEKQAGRYRLAANFETRCAEAKRHARVIKQILENGAARSGTSESSDADRPSC